MRILVVEDEKNIADAIAFRLKKENYIVDVSYDGEDGLDNALTDNYDLILLDIMLPYVDGFEILKEIHNEGISSKVIMLTAKTQIEDKLSGFELGANDYITKPFHMDELVARIKVQLMTNGQKSIDELSFGDLILNVKSQQLTCTSSNETIDVIAKEFQILEYFMLNTKQVLSREQIYSKVWGFDSEAESNNLEAYLSFIRKKFKIIESNVTIKAIRGVGYKLEIVNG